MQTIQENKINYFVFPYDSFSTGSLPSGIKSYFLYAYETMANDSDGGSASTITLTTESDRWRVASTYVESTDSQQNDRLFLRAGTTYEVQLRYGVLSSIIWSQVDTRWTDADWHWTYDRTEFSLTNSVIVSQDRAFCSGSVSPNQKLYISSNEDAVMTIYQG